jgi:DNA polymerase III epsilon subunit-like protein
MKQLIFLDTETTGNNLLTDHLFEVCYSLGGEEIKQEMFKPPVPISVKAQSITHVTNKMVADKPPFADSQMKQDLKNLLQDHVLVAHNAKFDIAMLAKEDVETKEYICTLKVARYLDEDGVISEYNLQYLRYHHELEIEALAHDAKSDVLVLEGVFKKLLATMLEKTSGDEEKALEKIIDVSKNPFLVKRFNFGKYKDRLVKDVYFSDKKYLEWLLVSMEQNDRDNDDWIFTLKHHLQIKD